MKMNALVRTEEEHRLKHIYRDKGTHKNIWKGGFATFTYNFLFFSYF